MFQSVNIWVVIPAAGSGLRMQAEKPKQYLSIAGKTVLEHTIDALLRFEPITAVQVCIAADDSFWGELHVQSSRVLKSTIGGATRAESVLAGLNALTKANQNDWVMVHDAARPCIDEKSLQRLVDHLSDHQVGGVLAVPLADTIKQVTEGRIEKTIDRTHLWAAQTPQMFRYGLLKKCLSQALEERLSVTDEAVAVEHYGYQPEVILGSTDNFKVTYPEDIERVRQHFARQTI